MSQANINHGDHPAADTHPEHDKTKPVKLPAANFRGSHPAADTYIPPEESEKKEGGK
jgi:hypothetical protein